MKGVVKTFDRGQGYGFITGDDGREYLVHFLAAKGSKPLVAGAAVEFTSVDTPKGLQAVGVSVVDG
jgi:CspA family cold shock protein